MLRAFTARRLRLLAAAAALSILCSCAAVTGEDPPDPATFPTEEGGADPTQPAPERVSPARLFGLCFTPERKYNPITNMIKSNGDVFRLVYESLFSADSTFTPQGVLCESFSRPDEVTYIFTLKSGSTFSDGAPLTSGDVIYSLNLSRAEGSPYAGRLSGVTDMRALSDSSVQITLAYPDSRFPILLDMPIIKKDTGGLDLPPGTGPYELISDEDGPRLLLRGGFSGSSGGSMPPLIELVPIDSPDEIIYAFERANISLISTDLTDTDPVVIKGDSELWEAPTSIMQYVGMNCAREPFSSQEFRRLITFAADRAAITRDIMGGHADPCALPVNPASPSYNPDVDKKYAYSREALAVGLDALGCYDSDNDGVLEYPLAGNARRPMSFDFIVNAENQFKVSAAKSVAGTLRIAGIAVTVRELKWDQYLAELEAGNFDLYYGEVRLAPDFNIESLIAEPGAPQSLNYGLFEDGGTLFERLGAYRNATGDIAASVEKQYFESFIQSAAFVPVSFKRHSVFTQRGMILGLLFSQSNIFYNFPDWRISY